MLDFRSEMDQMVYQINSDTAERRIMIINKRTNLVKVFCFSIFSSSDISVVAEMLAKFPPSLVLGSGSSRVSGHKRNFVRDIESIRKR